MEVEISDETQTAIDIGLGNALLTGSLIDFLIDRGVISRLEILDWLAPRGRDLEKDCDGYALPFQCVTAALRIERADRASERARSLRLVWSAEDGRCS